MILFVKLQLNIYGKVITIPPEILSSGKSAKRTSFIFALELGQKLVVENICMCKTVCTLLIIEEIMPTSAF